MNRQQWADAIAIMAVIALVVTVVVAWHVWGH